MIDLAHHHYERLPLVHINLECLIGIWAEPSVSNPIVADVARIEAPQISRNEDELVARARRIRIDRHALR